MFSVNPPTPFGMYVMESDLKLKELKMYVWRYVKLGYPAKEAARFAQLDAKCHTADLTSTDRKAFENFISALTY